MNRLFVLIILSFVGNLKGLTQNIYVTNVQPIANIKVFETSVSVQADIIVFKAPSPIYPGIDQNEGIWYFTEVQTLANKIICYTQTPVTADLIVYYTDIPTLAGWQNINKKELLKDND